MKTLISHYSLAVVASSLLFTSACIIINDEPIKAELGTHLVSVTPQCDLPSTTVHHRDEEDGSSRVTHYEFTCGDTTVLIRDNTLTVNGKSYGMLTERDRITIDYGKVRVNSEVRAEVR
jgi:hypothetical protein